MRVPWPGDCLDCRIWVIAYNTFSAFYIIAMTNAHNGFRIASRDTAKIRRHRCRHADMADIGIERGREHRGRELIQLHGVAFQNSMRVCLVG